MGRRKKNDVFLIGESLADPTEDLAQDGPAESDDQEPADASPGLGRRDQEPARSWRRPTAILSVALGLTAIASVELLGSGSDTSCEIPKTSARPALIQAPVAAAPQRPPASPPRADPPGRVRHTRRSDENGQGREPAPTETAPASQPVAPPLGEPNPEPAPPSPPPPSSGGGPAGAEEFAGFER